MTRAAANARWSQRAARDYVKPGRLRARRKWFMRNALLSTAPTAFVATLVGFALSAATAHGATLKEDSLICATESTAAFVARHPEMIDQPASELLRSLSSNVEKIQQRILPDPNQSPMTIAISRSMVALFKDVLDNCEASESGASVTPMEDKKNQVTLVSTRFRGAPATVYVMKRAIQ